MAVIDPVVPALAADWLKAHEWVQESGDGETSGCLTTALVTVCGEHPGDQYIWREIARHRGSCGEMERCAGSHEGRCFAGFACVP